MAWAAIDGRSNPSSWQVASLNIGPFQDGSGNRYVVLSNVNRLVVEVWKSTNGTTWSEVSGSKTTHDPVVSPRRPQFMVDPDTSGKLYIARLDPTTFQVLIDEFDITTGAWGSVVATGGPVIGDTTNDSGFNEYHLSRRTGGSVVLGYYIQETISATSVQRPWYSIYTGTWAAAIRLIPTSSIYHTSNAFTWRVVGMYRNPSDDRVHFILACQITGTMLHRSLSLGGVLGSLQLLPSSTQIVAIPQVGSGQIYTDASSVVRMVVPFQSPVDFVGSNKSSVSALLAASAENPNWEAGVADYDNQDSSVDPLVVYGSIPSAFYSNGAKFINYLRWSSPNYLLKSRCHVGSWGNMVELDSNSTFFARYKSSRRLTSGKVGVVGRGTTTTPAAEYQEINLVDCPGSGGGSGAF